MNNDEYRSTMQMLNNKQYELCSHIMYQLEKHCEQMFIFIEGGAGVGKALWVVLCAKQLQGFTEKSRDC